MKGGLMSVVVVLEGVPDRYPPPLNPDPEPPRDAPPPLEHPDRDLPDLLPDPPPLEHPEPPVEAPQPVR
jgi:hypothetical protein